MGDEQRQARQLPATAANSIVVGHAAVAMPRQPWRTGSPWIERDFGRRLEDRRWNGRMGNRGDELVLC